MKVYREGGLQLSDKIMSIPYLIAEMPEMLNFIQLAQKGNSFISIIETISGIVTNIITMVGYVVIIFTLNPF